jgi:glutamate N-acetyltransferase/amino-acid N-acetyltransferase
MFTSNAVFAAPVRLCREALQSGQAAAVIINSGCANACTGESGWDAAKQMAANTAEALGVAAENVFVCSTGTIGKPLPIAKISAALPQLNAALSEAGGAEAARAIMTTDTVPKEYAVELETGGVTIRVGGMAKGVGMIEPNLATMLAYITTDAAVAPDALQACLKQAVEQSFNSITVDGDMSTNDTVLLLANGVAGGDLLDANHSDWTAFCEAVNAVALALAKKMVADGEGATKFVTVSVQGAQSDADADLAARAIANSLLCKTAWFGGDPNWGRVIAAVGYSGAEVKQDLIEIRFGDVLTVSGGCMAPGVALADIEKVYAQKAFEIGVDLHLGNGVSTVYTCDCSYEYVKINAEYMT